MRDAVRYGSSTMGMYPLHKESVCAECGKTFLHTSEHAYRRTENGRLRMYCSYTCMRVKQKEDEKREREKFQHECEMQDRRAAQHAEYAERKKMQEHDVTCRKDAQRRLMHCQEKIKKYQQAWLNAAPGSQDRHSARKGLTRWERNLAYAQKVLAGYEKQDKEAEAECTRKAEGS